MALKATKIFTVTIPEKGVVLWDTTLKPLCRQLKRYYPEALSYYAIRKRLAKTDKTEFTTASGLEIIIQRLERKPE